MPLLWCVQGGDDDTCSAIFGQQVSKNSHSADRRRLVVFFPSESAVVESERFASRDVVALFARVSEVGTIAHVLAMPQLHTPFQ